MKRNVAHLSGRQSGTSLPSGFSSSTPKTHRLSFHPTIFTQLFCVVVLCPGARPVLKKKGKGNGKIGVKLKIQGICNKAFKRAGKAFFRLMQKMQKRRWRCTFSLIAPFRCRASNSGHISKSAWRENIPHTHLFHVGRKKLSVSLKLRVARCQGNDLLPVYFPYNRLFHGSLWFRLLQPM